MCPCNSSGYVGESICVSHLKEAYEQACKNKDFELAAVIIKKFKDMSKAVV